MLVEVFVGGGFAIATVDFIERGLEIRVFGSAVLEGGGGATIEGSEEVDIKCGAGAL